MPTTMTRRTCGFGHGPRFATPSNNDRRKYSKNLLSTYINYLFIDKSPEPGAYELKSDFAKPGSVQSRREKGHMYSFGEPHDKYRKVYVPGSKITHDSHTMPGPGHYKNDH